MRTCSPRPPIITASARWSGMPCTDPRHRPHGLYETLAAARHVDLAHEMLRAPRNRARVCTALDARGLQALLVKGAALAYSLYDEPWLRPRVDTDILVAHDSFGAADRVLRGLGYSPAAGVSTGEFVSHQVGLRAPRRHGVSHVIDLHWKTVNPQRWPTRCRSRFCGGTRSRCDTASCAARVPSHACSLLLACVHRLGHHQQHERLVWLYDIHLLAGTLDEGGWDFVVSTARDRGITRSVPARAGRRCRAPRHGRAGAGARRARRR